MAPLIASQQQNEDMPSDGRLAPEMPALDPADDEARIEALAKAMISADEPFHLLTVGALTDIARLLDHHAGIVAQWSSVTCMAGRLEDDPEYNVACDPAAARAVLGALGPRLVEIEACSNTLARQEAETALDPCDPVSAFLLDCYREYRRHGGWHGDTERSPLTLFDPIERRHTELPRGERP